MSQILRGYITLKAWRLHFFFAVDVKARLLEGKQTEQRRQTQDRVAKKEKTKGKVQLEKALKEKNKSNANPTIERNETQEAAYQDMRKRRCLFSLLGRKMADGRQANLQSAYLRLYFSLINLSKMFQLLMCTRCLIGVEEKFPGCILVNEMRMVCGKCKTAVNLNRIYYDEYFEKSKFIKR